MILVQKLYGKHISCVNIRKVEMGKGKKLEFSQDREKREAFGLVMCFLL
jgi:hypothetical protein